jgi:dihydropteroate synthase
MKWRACRYEFSFPRPVLIMGIVNVTPDSFSDGGRFMETSAATEHAVRLVAEGADILDVGGESTRPGAEPVPEAEELRRVVPVLTELRGKVRVPISIDTMKPAVARAALDLGAAIINDVSANRVEEEMWRLAADRGAGYVCMHMQGTPATMQSCARYTDVTQTVRDFFSSRLDKLTRCGVEPEQIILDPGFGFGKTGEHNLELLAALGSFTSLKRPLLVGVSRKSFLGRAEAPAARLAAGLACAVLAVAAGAQLIRTHDVAETIRAVRITEAILAKQKQ